MGSMTFERWTRLAEWPIAGAAVVFLILYGWLVIGQPTGSTLVALDIGLLVLWSVFAIDYLARLALAKPRGRWFMRNILLLAMVVLPFFRPLYLLRLLTLLTVLRRASGAAFRGKVAVYVSATALIIVVIGALGILDAEQNVEGALITSIEDALWWAIVTITTVGYGDLYPITALGRVIAVGLMISGIALVGSVTATLASWFVEMIEDNTRAVAAARGQSVDDASESSQ